MKALLIKGNDELKKVFKELTNQLNAVQPDNIQQKKMKLVFKNELFYDIKPSERLPSWVDVMFTFKEDNYGVREFPVSLPGQFFVYYGELNKYNLPIFNIKELNRIKDYAEEEEDFEFCSTVRDVIHKVEQKN